MALPEELLDELLSAHLDDALSDDERRRVEQMLRDDPAIKDRLEMLRKQQQDLLRSAMTVPDLPEGFAERVVKAAIERAEAESLSEDHPLRLAGRDNPPVQPVAIGWTTSKTIGVVTTLAACVLFAAFLLNRDVEPNGPDSEQLVADLNPDRLDELVSQEDVAPGPIEEAVPQSRVDDGTMLAQNDPPSVQGTPLPGTPDRVEESSVTENAGEPEVEPSPAMVANSDSPSVEPGRLAPSIAPLNMLLVIEVKRSEAGRVTDSFTQALAEVQIEIGDEREVDENLAKAVADSGQVETLGGQIDQVLLLESPAKKLDLLVNRLTSDREGVEGIGFSAITAQFDAPLLRSIDSVRTVDPTEIRHQGRTIPIVSHSGEIFQKWSGQLGDRNFAPLRSQDDAEMIRTMMAADNGPDQMASILFLIR